MKKILVVDDMAIFREPIAASLRREGYAVACASDGSAALEQLRSERCDVVLLDLAMPVKDGLACLAAIRKDPSLQRLPVIVLTALTGRGHILAARDLGIQGYLLKSQFSLEQMLARVRECAGPESDAAAVPAPSPETQDTDDQPHTETADFGFGQAPRGDAARGHIASRPGAPPATSESAAPARGPQPTLDAAQVRERIKADIQLRAVPAVLHHVLALTNRSASSFADVAQALRADPALALKVMRVGNSSMFATSKPAANLTEAAQRIGMTGIQNAIAAVLAIEHFDVSSAGGLTPQRFWEHSLATAVLTDEIRLAAKLPDGDTLFLGGLMHDIGKVVLSTLYPEAYRWVIEEAVRAPGDLTSVEESVFGLGHAEVAGEVLRKWGTPEELIQVVECHELSVARVKTSVSEPRRAFAIALADRMAHALLMGDDGQAVLSPLHELAHALGLSAQTILGIAKSAADKTTDMEMFYAAHGMGQISTPLAEELAGGAKAKVAVLARLANADPLALMFDRMGWIDPVQPEVAVLHVLSRAELGSKLQALSKLEGAGAMGSTPVVVASPDASIVPERAELGCRACAIVSLPGPYASIVGQVLTLRQKTGGVGGGNATPRMAQAARSS